MKITRDNYETWFLDYLEGRLGKEEEGEVRLFLDLNRDLAEELEAISPALVMDATIHYPGKERLKKSDCDDAFLLEQTAVAAMEGDLTAEETASFQKWLEKNPAGRAGTEILRLTRLQPDLSITFPGREKLKKKNTRLFLLTRIVAAAAILLLAFFLFLPSEKVPEQVEITSTAATPAEQQEKSPVPALPKQEEVRRQVTPNPVAVSLPPQKDAKALHGKEKAVRADMPRLYEPVGPLAARTVLLRPDAPLYDDLVPVRVYDQVYYASNEIQLSEYLNIKLQALKADGPKGFFSREEIAVAGLRFFSKLPGRHLTGKKGNDGKLRSISFNTQAMAFSIPVNK